MRPVIVNGGMPKAKTSASGTFTFDEIPAGVYVIEVGSDQVNFTGGYIYIKKDSGPELGIIDLSPAVKVNIASYFASMAMHSSGRGSARIHTGRSVGIRQIRGNPCS